MLTVAYDCTSPSFLRVVKSYKKYLVGSCAGKINHTGYYDLRNPPEGSVERLAHRIVWELHNGPIPDGLTIDHIDGDKTNNSIENLRLAYKTLQMLNRPVRSDRKDNLPKGVFRNGSKFMGRYSFKGKRIAKNFNTVAEAADWVHHARCAAVGAEVMR